VKGELWMSRTVYEAWGSAEAGTWTRAERQPREFAERKVRFPGLWEPGFMSRGGEDLHRGNSPYWGCVFHNSSAESQMKTTEQVGTSALPSLSSPTSLDRKQVCSTKSLPALAAKRTNDKIQRSYRINASDSFDLITLARELCTLKLFD
jgi:hypothetical protein